MTEIFRYIGPDGMLPSDFLREISSYVSCPDLRLYSDDVIDTYITDRRYLASYLPEIQRLSAYIASDVSLIVGAQVLIASRRVGFVLRCFLAEAQIRARYQYYTESIYLRMRSIDITYVPAYEDYRRWAPHIDYFMPEGVIEGGWVAQIQAHFQDIHARRISRYFFSLANYVRIVV